MKKIKSLCLIILFSLFYLTGCSFVSTNEPTKVEKEIVEIQNDITEVYKKISTGCVGIYASNDKNASVGSGVVYKEENNLYYVVTNNHVVEDMTSIRIYRGGSKYLRANLIGTDAKNDIAVLTFSLDIFGGSDVYVQDIFNYDEEIISVGQTVLAIGCPLGLENFNTLTTGVVSRITKTQIQTNAEINPGNSGGGLFNASGRLIGINTQKEVYTQSEENGNIINIPVEGIGFAIHLDVVKKCIKDIEKKNSSITRPTLGLTVQPVNRYISTDNVSLLPNTIDQALVVIEVSDGVANKAGIKPNDVILKANDTNIESSDELSSILNLLLSNDILKLEIYRPSTNEFMVFNITLK